MNRFSNATTIQEVVGQAIGAGSMCWIPNTGDLEFDSTKASSIVDEAVARIHELEDTWLCPNCWQRWHVAVHCPDCGRHPPIGLYRHPPVDPITGQVSADDDAISMGQMRHCDVPERFRRLDCTNVMDDHGWKDDGTRDGVTVCPPHD